MPTPQHGIFALGTRSHHHLQFDVVDGTDAADVLPALRSIRERATTVSGVNLVIGFGARFGRLAIPRWMPEDLGPFQPVVGPDGTTFPADQHDLWLWLHASGPDATFDLANHAARCLDDLAVVAAEQPSFTYLASRDLTGFEDGTENPPLDEAPTVGTIPDGRAGAGGSVVLLQRWVHDLKSFAELERPDKDQVIGRDYVTSEELPDDVRSPRAHISRVVIEDDEGEELEIFRRSTAYGGVLENGLMFVAFSADLARLERMLQRMAGIGDGVRDRLTDFTRSTGAAWYAAAARGVPRGLMDVGDLDPDPVVQVQAWRDDVVAAGLHEPDAMVLCTAPAGEQASPVGRFVLLRGIDERGFAFVTNRESRKGRHLAANPNASLVFPWYPIRRQVIVIGTVVEAPDDESDAYWRTRPRGSQVAAWASPQSRPLPDRAALEREWDELAGRFADGPVPRPDNWGMYRLTPSSIEFWHQGENRMHDRLVYERAGDAWTVTRLAP